MFTAPGGCSALDGAVRVESSERELDSGLAVAERIVRGAQSRIEVPVVRYVLHRRKRSRRNKRPGRQIGLRNRSVQVVQADTEIQRHLSDRPLILHVGRYVPP